jgi:hypothetical protein
MLVRASTIHPRGTRLDFQLADVGGTGEIIWTRELEEGGALIGLKFLKLKRSDRKSLHRILTGAPSPEAEEEWSASAVHEPEPT